MAKVHTNFLTTEELKSEFRDYKLKVLSGEIKFTPLNYPLDSVYLSSKKHKDLLYFISDTFSNDIVSGSLALSLFGLLHRQVNDIDILIDDKNRYDGYNKDGYSDDEFSTPNRLGYKKFKYKRGIFTSEKEYNVDFFENVGASFITVDFDGKKVKVHNPLEIMDYKLNMAINPKVIKSTSRKHNEDLTQIFGQMSWQLI